ncbi:MAG: rRNA maturation RNase YbeY [Brumimicrobium sp.]|nr:rRNA maturation RNase YbeY [Brumimicrobium sp.]
MNEQKILGDLALVIGTDEWLLEINQQYLQHDYFTDVITFDYCFDDVVSGDLLISLDRVFDNAQTFNVSRETELNRVIIHGVLHLCGYKDKTEEDIKIIREKEDYYLSLL